MSLQLLSTWSSGPWWPTCTDFVGGFLVADKEFLLQRISKGFLQGTTVNFSRAFTGFRFAHNSHTVWQSRKQLSPCVSRNRFVGACHTSCVDTNVLQLVNAVTSTVFVLLIIPWRLLELLYQRRVGKLGVRGNRERTQILAYLSALLQFMVGFSVLVRLRTRSLLVVCHARIHCYRCSIVRCCPYWCLSRRCVCRRISKLSFLSSERSVLGSVLSSSLEFKRKSASAA